MLRSCISPGSRCHRLLAINYTRTITVEIINESGTGVNQLLTGAEFDGMLTIHRRIGQTNGLPK